jgi:4-methyl-5(b-hydroxyethyl)-thiazole monophosphate biosynthesis
MASVLVPIADGSEEIETVCIVDTLVRAGATVTICSVGSSAQVTCSRGVRIVANTTIEELGSTEFDAIAIPGADAAGAVVLL